jgi:hypothetical protein
MRTLSSQCPVRDIQAGRNLDGNFVLFLEEIEWIQ